MTWLTEHSGAINVLINIGMLIVWITYLQLGLMAYLRARKPRLILNRGAGVDIEAICLVGNMSQEPVYVQNAYCTIHTSEGDYSMTVTDREVLQGSGAQRRPDDTTSQGPLKQGDFMSLGTFDNMLRQTCEHSGMDDCTREGLADSIRSLDIMVVAAFGGDDLEIAARREFRIATETDAWQVIPMGPDTRQISSRRERMRIRKMIVEELGQR